MSNTYIFGASNLGELAFNFYKKNRSIIGFIDNDAKKQGREFCGLPVFSPSIIENLKDEVIVASSFYKEIQEQLIKLNFFNYSIFTFALIQPELYNSKRINNVLPLLSLNELVKSVQPKCTIDNITFLNGGSTLMDYVFLKAVALRINAKTFLEIGAWTGESAAAVAEVVKHVYSISLPDNDYSLKVLFDEYCHKENISRFFSKNISNITNFEENSFAFNYNNIPDNIDIVFIDGDHSYQAICKDTSNIFKKYGYEDTVVIWHDFKNLYNELVETTYQAIIDTLPKDYHENIFAVQGNYCGVYIPKRYQYLFHFDESRSKLFSYKLQLVQEEHLI